MSAEDNTEEAKKPQGAWWEAQMDHEYDGIREADSELPRWWLATLFGAIVFAGCYWFYYQSMGIGTLGKAALAEESAVYAAREAERLRSSGLGTGPEALATLSKDPVTLAKGRTIFVETCAVCHKDDGSGNIGPNLTDRYWLHGAGNADIWMTIKEGVKDKGMAAWGTQLGGERTQAVAAYVISMRNTDVKGKDPQGDLVP
jgi:cytochrome c oxidase cbb3-type subunit III